MEELLNFYQQLAANNNKPWFDAHKEQYLKVKATGEALAVALMQGVADFDPLVRGLQVKDMTYRIYRDLRFTPDKRPYKDWYGIYICPRGKCSGMAGYYVHLQPSEENFFLCAGLYNPSKAVIKSVREAVMLTPEEMPQSLADCSDFHLPWEHALQRVPAPYQATAPHSEYYRLRSYEIYKPLTREQVLHPDFLAAALSDLRRTAPYNAFLNKCFDYANSAD